MVKSGLQNSYVSFTSVNASANVLGRFIPAILILVMAQMVSCTTISTHSFQPVNKSRNRHTQLAQFQLSAYLINGGTKLRVSVDKQMGGKVTIQFINVEGAEYYYLTLSSQATMVRFNLNLAELNDGDYMLKVSNGLEMELRKIKIVTTKPTVPVRQIIVL